MKYTCERCKKIFKQKIDYTRHVNRKKPCKKNSHKISTKNNKSSHKFTCPNCHKTYVSKYTLTRHIGSYCKVLKEQINVKNKNVKNNRNEECILEHVRKHINIEEKCNINILISSNKEDKSSHSEDKSSHKEDVKVKCIYCKNYITKKNISRHKKKCINNKIHLHKIIEDKNTELEKNKIKIKKLIKKNNDIKKEKELKIQELTKALETVEDEYFAFSKQVALNNKSINITNNNDNKKINMCFIIRNYTDAKNFDELMDPDLTQTEIEYIKENGPASGSQMLLNDRCVDGLKIEERPIHCVDISRNKYMLRIKDDWKIDKNAKIIMNSIVDKIKSIYNIKIDGTENKHELEKKLNNLCSLLNLEGKDRRKIINHLNIKTSIKNI